MPKRVVVTGMGAVTSLGSDWQTLSNNLRLGKSGVSFMPEWDRYTELNTRLGGAIRDFVAPAHYTRKQTRSMGRIALMSTRATELALIESGLLDDPVLTSGTVGIAYGSSAGSPEAIRDFGAMLVNSDMSNVSATTYIRMMAHTAAVNTGIFFGLKGRIIPTNTACTSGSMGIGAAYECIKYGKQLIMVAGGAEELCASEAAVFDTLYATSTKNDMPGFTPRPFDKERDGLVIGEGAGTLILEELDHAKARGATIYAELVGYGSNSDGGHVTQPDRVTMQVAMELGLQDAGLQAQDIGYINAHGTATDRGDIAESHATQNLFGAKTPISTLKGNLGHTLGACGAIEAWASIHMMNDGWFAPTHNLENPDPECGELDYLMGQGRSMDIEFLMSNNFAFGGINTSLIFKRWPK
jgi:3-oxoacyl-[acyl-carrier-protein] synthase II